MYFLTVDFPQRPLVHQALTSLRAPRSLSPKRMCSHGAPCTACVLFLRVVNSTLRRFLGSSVRTCVVGAIPPSHCLELGSCSRLLNDGIFVPSVSFPHFAPVLNEVPLLTIGPQSFLNCGATSSTAAALCSLCLPCSNRSSSIDPRSALLLLSGFTSKKSGNL